MIRCATAIEMNDTFILPCKADINVSFPWENVILPTNIICNDTKLT